ncbi:MAG TPA: hypothetical protein VJA46_07155 [Acidimicrobiia bacterium]|nr:hypothetical protein [Acidimicrobiia bacterium]
MSVRDRWLDSLRFSAIPFIGWTLGLILFWPGMMTIDSVWQWHQLDDVGLDNWHPFFYAVVLGLLRRVADTPALPLLLTMVVGSLLIGRFAAWTTWQGRSSAAAWSSLLLILLVPATALIPIVLWKDVVYGLGLFGLTLIIWRIEETEGSWLGRWSNVGALVVSLLTLWLCRHNGWPVVIVILTALFVFHRQRWRRLVLTAATVIGLATLVTGPFAAQLDVAPSQLTGVILAHRVAMHIARGTPLTGEEREYLESIKSLDSEWPYSCSSIVPTYTPPNGLDPSLLESEVPRLRSLVLDLTMRHPRAELRHIICSSRLLWSPVDPESSTFFLGLSRVGGEINYIDDFGADTPVEASPVPRLVSVAYDVVRSLPEWLIRPALYMYLLVGALVFAAVRRRTYRVYLIGLPVMLNTLLLIPFTISQDVRFQFGLILTAVAWVPALFTVARSRGDSARLLEWPVRQEVRHGPS